MRDYPESHPRSGPDRGLLHEGAKVGRGEGERQKEEKVTDFRQAMRSKLASKLRARSRAGNVRLIRWAPLLGVIHGTSARKRNTTNKTKCTAP